MASLFGAIGATLVPSSFNVFSSVIGSTNIGAGTSVGAPNPGSSGSVPNPCFTATSPVRMADGSLSNIADLQIGDVVARGGAVTALMKFDEPPPDFHLCRLGNVVATPGHSVYNEGAGSFMPFVTYLEMEGLGSCDETVDMLYDIDTENHLIEFEDGVIFTDFNEHDPNEEIGHIEKLLAVEEAEMALGMAGLEGLHFLFGTSFAASSLVMMADGSFKEIADVELGDQVAVGGKVTGVFKLSGDDEMCRVGGSDSTVLVETDHGIYSKEAGDFVFGNATAVCEEGEFEFLYHLETAHYYIVFQGGIMSHSYSLHPLIHGIRAMELMLTQNLVDIIKAGDGVVTPSGAQEEYFYTGETVAPKPNKKGKGKGKNKKRDLGSKKKDSVRGV